jgi:hypothetical protein
VILAYQGVIKRETNESPLAIARQIAADGITEGQIRDEVCLPPSLSLARSRSYMCVRAVCVCVCVQQLFCQLCKQTCYTPNEYLVLLLPLSCSGVLCRSSI